MNFNSILDIKEYLAANPIPDDLSKLSKEDKNKIFNMLDETFNKVLEFILHVEDASLEDEAYNSFSKYVLDGIPEDYEDEITEKLSDASSQWLPQLMDKMLDKLDSENQEVDDKLLTIINMLFNIQKKISDNILSKYNEIFDRLVKVDLKYTGEYLGDKTEYHEISLDKEYVASEDVMDYTYNLPKNKRITLYRMLLKRDYDAVINSRYLKDDSSVDILEENDNYGLVIIDAIVNNDCNNEAIIKLIRYYIAHYGTSGISSVYYDASGKKDSELTAETVNELYAVRPSLMADPYRDYEVLFGSVLKRDYTQLRYYNGKVLSPELRQKICNDDSIIDEATVMEIDNLYKNGKFNIFCFPLYDAIFKKIVSQTPSFIKYYRLQNFSIFSVAIKNSANSSQEVKIDKKILVRILLSGQELTEEETSTIYNQFNTKPINRDCLYAYPKNHIKLLESFNKIDYLLELLGIDREVFIQFSFGSSYDWLEAMTSIFDKNEMEIFANVKKLLFEKVYHIDNNIAGAMVIKNLMEVLKNYTRYPQLCKDLLSGEYTDEDLKKLMMLFNNQEVIGDNNKFESKSDLFGIGDIIFTSYQSKINNAIASDDLDEVCNILCILLFGMNLRTTVDKIATYGNVEDFRQLLFNNRMNQDILDDIHEAMIYVSMIQDILACEDINSLKAMLTKILNDKEAYKLCQRTNLLFRDYDERMCALYGKEASVNLTKFSNVPEELIDKEMTKKYGVKVIDFSDRKYCDLAHVAHESRADAVMSGATGGRSMLISLSAISNRCQNVLHPGPERIIFLCDEYNSRLFIRSTATDLHSNRALTNYSYEINSEKFHDSENIGAILKQRGILEISIGNDRWPSEILSYRQGIKFSAISLPGGREPTEKEIEIAKKYNLIFVKTQEINKTIINPKDIYDVSVDDRNHQISSDSERFSEIRKLKDFFTPVKLRKNRRIAVITDAHGLFEPTLSALEGAHNLGADEIYSLGDNVGLGPNPKEVMDLLDAYGVKSVKGNHEEYIIDGVEKFKEHFTTESKYENAVAGTRRTAALLTKQQIDAIKAQPKDIIIEIGGKKILLTHWIKDYNTGKKRQIPDDISDIFQGHIHFKGDEGNLHTVKAVGFDRTKPTTSLITIDENINGGIDFLTWNSGYDSESMMYDLEEAGLCDEDKVKLGSWTSGRSR